jgi:hypothetical protein
MGRALSNGSCKTRVFFIEHGGGGNDESELGREQRCELRVRRQLVPIRDVDVLVGGELAIGFWGGLVPTALRRWPSLQPAWDR